MEAKRSRVEKAAGQNCTDIRSIGNTLGESSEARINRYAAARREMAVPDAAVSLLPPLFLGVEGRGRDSRQELPCVRHPARR